MKKSKKLDWISLSKKERKDFVKHAKAMKAGTPVFFNLKSDRNDPPSRFRKMTKKQVIAAAEDSARFLRTNYL